MVRSMTVAFVRGLRGLALAFVLLAPGAAGAQPPGGTVDTAPAVSIPALPEALRAPAVQQPAEPLVGPILQEPDPPAEPSPDGAVLATDVVVGQDPVEADPEAPVADVVEPVGEDVPASPVAEPGPEAPPVMGAESDLSLAEQAAALLGGTLDPSVPAAVPSGARLALAGGAADLAQSLARAVFAAPVAGSIPYVVQAQVHHDVTLIFPVEWPLVQVFVGDPRRWAVTHSGSLVVLKPGEAGARTNLTAVLASGEVLQMDLEEVTGLAGARRTGRVYVGPESWLVDRIFSMLPADVRRRVAEAPVSVAQLLADPVAVVGLYGGTGAVPSPAGLEPLPAAAPLEPAPAPAPESAADLDPVTGVFGGPEPAAGAFGGPGPAAATAPADRFLRIEGPEPPGEYVSGQELAALESRLRDARARVDTARRSAGDRIAAAQLGLEADLEALREEYPLRTQFSYVLDPSLPPYTEPLWHFGVWHDGDRTYWRLLAPDPVFRDADSGEPLAAERIDDFLYRFDRVVERGVVLVRLDNDPQVRELYFRRRRELEGP